MGPGLVLPRLVVQVGYALLIALASVTFLLIGVSHLGHVGLSLATVACFAMAALYAVGGVLAAPHLVGGLPPTVTVSSKR